MAGLLAFIAPTSTMLRGHRSRTSKTNGTRFKRASQRAATAVRNCGEVPTTTSGRSVRNGPNMLADSQNDE